MNTAKPRFKLFAARRDREAAMPFIMLTVLIDMVAIGLIIPVLPALVGSFTGTQADQAFWYGVVAFAFSVANFSLRRFWARCRTGYGRRPVLLLGFCGLALSFFATALATASWMLIAVRLVGGAMQSNLAVANAYVADITPPEQRAKRFGMLGAMFGVGFILGPVMGGLLGAINLRLPFFAAGGLALLNLLYGYFVLPESLPEERRQAFHWRAANPVAALRRLAQLKGVGTAGASWWPAADSRSSCSTPAGCCTPLQVRLGAAGKRLVAGRGRHRIGRSYRDCCSGRLLKRFSPRRLAVLGLVSSTIAYALWGAATQGWMMYAIIFLNLLGPTVLGFDPEHHFGRRRRAQPGQTLGAVSGLNSLMAVIAPTLAAPLLAMVSHLPKGDWRIGTPFYFCALLQGAALLLAVSHFRRQRRERGPARGGLTGARKAAILRIARRCFSVPVPTHHSDILPMAAASSNDGREAPPPAASAYVALESGAYASTDLTRGPWHPQHQHGGPPIALVARCIERAAAALELTHVARLTANLLRPVPIAELAVEVRTDYAGRNVAHFSAQLNAGGKEVARFTAVAQREAGLDIPADCRGIRCRRRRSRSSSRRRRRSCLRARPPATTT